MKTYNNIVGTVVLVCGVEERLSGWNNCIPCSSMLYAFNALYIIHRCHLLADDDTACTTIQAMQGTAESTPVSEKPGQYVKLSFHLDGLDEDERR
jgi:hypothetical protein